jgi:molybdopterin molybdotransferase
MEGVPYFISVEEALDIVKRTPLPRRLEEVKLNDSHGRILAEDLASKVDDPPFDNSSMDGFACKHEPDANYPKTYPIQGIVPAAGEVNERVLEPNNAYRIMTGAPLPKGADSILQIERCTIDENDNTVTLLEAPKPHFVRKQGENLKQGTVSLKAGSVLTPFASGPLCDHGVSHCSGHSTSAYCGSFYRR